jgi:hypothetical protein
MIVMIVINIAKQIVMIFVSKAIENVQLGICILSIENYIFLICHTISKLNIIIIFVSMYLPTFTKLHFERTIFTLLRLSPAVVPITCWGNSLII